MDTVQLMAPKDCAGSLRQILENHLREIVTRSNAITQAKLDYIAGDQAAVAASGIDLSGWTQYVVPGSKEQRSIVAKNLVAIDLSDLGAMPDCEILERYNRTLIRLNEIWAPPAYEMA